MEKTQLPLTDVVYAPPEKIDILAGTNTTTTLDHNTKTEAEHENVVIEATKHDNVFVTSWKQWANETTLHGVKVISDSKESKLKRILRLILLCAFLGLLAYIGYDQTVRYLEYNTVTKETIVFEEEIEFPAVTICNHEIIHRGHTMDPREELALRYIYGWPRETQETWFLDAVTNSLGHILKNYPITIDELVSLCYFGRVSLDCDERFRKLETNFGTCFTFNSLNETDRFASSILGSDYGFTFDGIARQNNFKLSHDGSVGLKILIHPRDEERPDMTRAMTLSPGFTHYIAISKHEFTYLPSPVKAFDKEECVETNAVNFLSPLMYHAPYTVSSCIEECLMVYINSTCGCIGPFFTPDLADAFPECTPRQYVSCHEDAVANFSKDKLLQHCYCPIPCQSVHYETKLSSALYPSMKTATDKYPDEQIDEVRQNYLRVRIYFDNKRVTVNNQVLEYEFADLLGSYGGYLGLALGASMLTLLELLEQVVISCYEFYKNRNRIKPSG